MKARLIYLTPAMALVLTLGVPAVVLGALKSVTLDHAIALALQKNEGIIISRESAAIAEAAVSGAKGAYNPVFEFSGGWQRLKEPASSLSTGSYVLDGVQTTEAVESKAALSQYLPSGGSLSLSARTTRGLSDRTYDALSPAYQARIGVELRQPLLRNFRTDPERSAIRVADANRERSDAEVDFTTTEILASVERAYWNLAAARAAVDVREESVRLAEEQLAETQTRVKSGSAPETEAAQPRAELERRRGELLESREMAARAETGLKTLILADTDAALWQDTLVTEEDGAPEVTLVDRGNAMERALQSRPELEIAQTIVDRSQVEHTFARNNTWPSLDAVVSYERFGIAGDVNSAASTITGSPIVINSSFDGGWSRSWDQIADGDFDDIRAGLVFSYPIGNGSALAAEDAARHIALQSEAELTRARKSVRADVLNAVAALETAGQRMEAARAGREAAEIQLKAEEDRYGVGLTTNFLVLTRQNDLSRARLDEIEARADYRIASTEFARATGTLLERHQIQTQSPRK